MGKVNRGISLIIPTILTRKIVSLCVFFLFVFSHSQSLTGNVFNSEMEVVEGAIISAKPAESEETAAFAISDGDGKYTIKLPPGRFQLSVKKLGFKNIETTIIVENKTIIKDFSLQKNNDQQIQEVIITKAKSIRIKSDTVEYNAKNFKDGTERNVEDLLKKLPGLTVDSNGKIKIRGKEIEKVMVENDDFFEKGYSLLTKNMSVRPVETVQVLENYSNNKLLKGVEKSDKIVINLVLEENAKAQWFGELTLSNSVFPMKKYDDKLSLARFAQKYKYFLIASANSVGKDNTGDLTHLLNPTAYNEPGYIDIHEHLYTYNSTFAEALMMDPQKYKFNDDKLISNNAIFALNTDMKIKLTNVSTLEKVTANNEINTTFSFDNVNFNNEENRLRNLKKNTFFNKLNYDFNISPKSSLKIDLTHNLWHSDNVEELNLNGLSSGNESNTTNHLFTSSLLHTQKFGDRTVLLTGLRFFDQDISNNFYSDRFYFQDLFNFAVPPENFSQDSNNKLRFLGILSQVIHRNKSENIWDFSLQFSDSKKSFYNRLDAISEFGNFNFSDLYANDYKGENKEFRLSSNYKFQWLRANFSLKLDANYLDYESSNVQQKKWRLNPNVNLNFSPHYKGNFIMSVYLNSNKNPVFDLLPNYFSDSPRTFRKGNEENLFSNIFGANFRYSYGHYADRFTFSVYRSLSNYLKYQSSKYQFEPMYTITDLVYLNNRKDLFLNSEVNYYLGFLKSNLKFNFISSQSNYQEIFNSSQLRDIQRNYNSLALELQSGWKKNTNYFLGTNFNFVKYRSTIVSENAYQKIYGRINYNASRKLSLQITNSYYSFQKFFNSESSYNFLDGKIAYKFSDEIQFTLLGNNLTNTNKFIQSSINSYSSYEARTNLLPRNIMLEMFWSLSK